MPPEVESGKTRSCSYTDIARARWLATSWHVCARSQPPPLDKYQMALACAGGHKCFDQHPTSSIRANGRRLCVARCKWRLANSFEMNTSCRRNSRPNRQRASSARIKNTIPTATSSVRVDRRSGQSRGVQKAGDSEIYRLNQRRIVRVSLTSPGGLTDSCQKLSSRPRGGNA